MPAYDSGTIVVTCKARTKCGYDFSLYYPLYKKHRYFEAVRGVLVTAIVNEQQGEEILTHPSVDYARRFEFIDPVQCEAEVARLQSRIGSYLSSADIVKDILEKFSIMFDPNSYALAASGHRPRNTKKTCCLIESQPYAGKNPEDGYKNGKKVFQVFL